MSYFLLQKPGYNSKKSVSGTAIPTSNSTPPRPQSPLGPLTMTMPVKVITSNATANTSEKIVQARDGL